MDGSYMDDNGKDTSYLNEDEGFNEAAEETADTDDTDTNPTEWKQGMKR